MGFLVNIIVTLCIEKITILVVYSLLKLYFLIETYTVLVFYQDIFFALTPIQYV